LRYQFTFRTNTFDSITCETATLYFSFEQYPKDDGAAHSFDYIKTENKKTSTVTDITDVGNEGFVAKDAMNYPFIMIRNKTRLFKLKMRHHISTSSYNTMLALMKKIVANN
jgi:hypothetical protein